MTEPQKRPRRQGKRPNRSNTSKGGGQQNRSAGRNSGKANPKRRNRNNRNRGPRLEGFEKIERSYLVLTEKHIQARKKYYEFYHRANPQQLAKLERQFYQSLKEIRDFEDSISEEFKEQFNAKFNGLRLDTTYTENHEINSEGQLEVAAEGPFEDPHLLRIQQESNYADDDEESSGSLDDYLRYKGLS